ncbi:cytochrome C biosynthesis protein [Chromatiales bacterium (ex Bugula neritina AB1)]|nr:cytochrome C biosynthesis protein [Chromatiales bacterium (ex Bugula neritina AB1)]
MTFFWAWLAGVLTLINPCVLPLLPVIIAGAFQGNRHGPIYMAVGLTVSFTVVGVLVTAFGHLIGLSEEVINRVAAIMMIIFGTILLIPVAQEKLATVAAPLASGANNRMYNVKAQGAAGQFYIGLLLGAVWSPCVGPTLGGAIGLAATGEGLMQATLTMISFGIGVSTILLLLSYGSRELLTARRNRLMKWMPWAKPIMGCALLLVGFTLLFHWNQAIDAWLLDVMPVWLQDLSVSV